MPARTEAGAPAHSRYTSAPSGVPHLAHHVGSVFLRDVDDASRAQFTGDGETLRVRRRAEHHDLPAGGSRHLHGEQANGARPSDDHQIAGTDMRQLRHGPNGESEGFGEGCVAGRDIFWQGMDAMGRDDDEAGEATVVDVANQLFAGAHIVLAGAAGNAFSTLGEGCLAGDALADVQVLEAGAQFDDAAGEFMAHDEGGTQVELDVPVTDVQVGSANAGGLHFDHDLIGARRGGRCVTKCDVARPGGGFHECKHEGYSFQETAAWRVRPV